MLTQEEIVVYPGPTLNQSNSSAKLERFPLSQILSQDHILFIEKIVSPRSGDKDFIVLMTSDLVIHTIDLSLKGSMNSNVSPQQLMILSSHDTKNVIVPSEVPKLKRVIQSAVMQYQDMQLVFALFDNLSYIIAKVTDGSGSQAAQSLV